MFNSSRLKLIPGDTVPLVRCQDLLQREEREEVWSLEKRRTSYIDSEKLLIRK
jgi:hypothetical protein